jgi:hypothetical protein
MTAMHSAGGIRIVRKTYGICPLISTISARSTKSNHVGFDSSALTFLPKTGIEGDSYEEVLHLGLSIGRVWLMGQGWFAQGPVEPYGHQGGMLSRDDALRYLVEHYCPELLVW